MTNLYENYDQDANDEPDEHFKVLRIIQNLPEDLLEAELARRKTEAEETARRAEEMRCKRIDEATNLLQSEGFTVKKARKPKKKAE